MKFTCSGKIRQRHIPSPVKQAPTKGRPRGRRSSAADTPRRDVAGIDSKRYPKVPVELSNRIQSATLSFLKGLLREVQRKYEAGIESHLVELLEDGIPGLLAGLGRELIAAQLEQERGYHGPRIKDQQGDVLEYEGERPITVLTPLGEVPIRRSYYRGSGKVLYPLDKLLGTEEHAILPGLQQNIALLSSRASFPDSTDILNRLLPLSISLKRVEKVAETIAKAVQQDQELRIERAFSPGGNLPAVRKEQTTVVCLDGGMCRVRDDAEKYKEFKLAVMGRLQDKDVLDKHYVAHFGEPDNLSKHLITDFFALGHAGSSHLHIIADGAHWIWKRADELCQEHQKVTMLLDYYHVSERLGELARALFSAPEAEAQKAKMIEHLFEERFNDFFTTLSAWTDLKAKPEALQLARDAVTYFENNRGRLGYKACRDAGLPIGSGMVEGGVRFVGKDRLDKTGMRWSVPGAERILQLRCLDASRNWDAFWAAKASKRKQDYFTGKQCWVLAA